MNNKKIAKLKLQAAKADKILGHLPEEQTEAVFSNTIKYKPTTMMERIKLFRKDVGDTMFFEMLPAPWFLQLLEIWDDEQKQVNTVAFVDDLYKFIPKGEDITRDDVAAWVQIEKLKEEEGE